MAKLYLEEFRSYGTLKIPKMSWKTQFFDQKTKLVDRLVLKSLRMNIYFTPNHENIWGKIWLAKFEKIFFKAVFDAKMRFLRDFSCFQLSSDHQTESMRKREKRRHKWSDIPPPVLNTRNRKLIRLFCRSQWRHQNSGKLKKTKIAKFTCK